jgi:hypothetical protein
LVLRCFRGRSALGTGEPLATDRWERPVTGRKGNRLVAKEVGGVLVSLGGVVEGFVDLSLDDVG